MSEEKKEPKYEDVAKRLKDNLDTHESFYYAALMKSGEHGKEGQIDGLHASLWGLRNKIGLEGIIASLEAQGEASIKEGNGLNAEFSLAKAIEVSASIFQESLTNLKARDIIPYITGRVNAEIVKKYENKNLKQLLDKKASEEERDYGTYLMAQTQNAVMARMAPIVAQEKARKINEAYLKVSQKNEAEK